MNAFISTLLVLGLCLVGMLLVILVGQLITRTDLYRRWADKRGQHYPRSRVIEDFRPVQETTIEFIDTSPPGRGLLHVLAEADEPIRVRKLLRSVRAGESSWTAFFLIAVSGVVRFEARGVVITDLGREILARMSGGASEASHETSDCRQAVTEDKLQSSDSAQKIEDTSQAQFFIVAPNRNERHRLVEPARLIRSFEPPHIRAQPAAFATSDLYARSNAKKSSPFMLTAADHRELTDAIIAARKLAAYKTETRMLQEKLADAVIRPSGQVPPDVITLHSRVELLDRETGEQVNLMLVFPIDSNLEQGRISVFDPLGIAILGQRVSDRFDWTVPYGVRHFEVRAVHFQPEAALAKAA